MDTTADLDSTASFSNKKGDTPLHIAAKKGNFEICKLFLANIGHKNPENIVGCTPLYGAFQNNHFEICQLIIDNVDDMSSVENNGSLPAQNGIGIFKFIYHLFCTCTK